MCASSSVPIDDYRADGGHSDDTGCLFALTPTGDGLYRPLHGPTQAVAGRDAAREREREAPAHSDPEPLPRQTGLRWTEGLKCVGGVVSRTLALELVALLPDDYDIVPAVQLTARDSLSNVSCIVIAER